MPFLTSTRVDDPRPELKRLRRSELKKKVRDYGVDFDENTTTADELRVMVSSNNIPYEGSAHELGQNEAPSKAIARFEKENTDLREEFNDLKARFTELLGAKESAAEEIAESTAIEAGKFPESFHEEDKTPIWRLRQYAKLAGIEFVKTDKAVDLIEKLNRRQREAE